ncbi:hypothetical protein KC19_VG122100 [Ceratodon purpureus]|uniref:Uncharacterized protein n=1 Tax=Ceratodon purpureus TaxID=3225 RepID=A0A8T0HPE8_CERPU|nr:hypothetical protein KC19_VG122100 [Ceratodon purpureus]
MKRVHGVLSHPPPVDVEGVRSWLRRVKLYEEVNWEAELPSYAAVEHLLDDDFVFEWTPLCTRQYEAIVRLTGVVHRTMEGNNADTPMDQNAPVVSGDASGGHGG